MRVASYVCVCVWYVWGGGEGVTPPPPAPRPTSHTPCSHMSWSGIGCAEGPGGGMFCQLPHSGKSDMMVLSQLHTISSPFIPRDMSMKSLCLSILSLVATQFSAVWEPSPPSLALPPSRLPL